MVGENLEIIINFLWQLVTLKHQHIFFSSGWDIYFVIWPFGLLGCHFCLIPYDPCCLRQTFDPLVPKRCRIQESCHRYVQEYNPSAVYTLTSSSDILFHHLPLVPYVMSLMWETSWSSYDGLSPVNSCWHQLLIQEIDLEIPFSTLELTCLNGKFFAPDDQLTSSVVDWTIPRVFDFNSFLHTSWIVLGSNLRTIGIIGGFSHAC